MIEAHGGRQWSPRDLGVSWSAAPRYRPGSVGCRRRRHRRAVVTRCGDRRQPRVAAVRRSRSPRARRSRAPKPSNGMSRVPAERRARSNSRRRAARSRKSSVRPAPPIAVPDAALHPRRRSADRVRSARSGASPEQAVRSRSRRSSRSLAVPTARAVDCRHRVEEQGDDQQQTAASDVISRWPTRNCHVPRPVRAGTSFDADPRGQVAEVGRSISRSCAALLPARVPRSLPESARKTQRSAPPRRHSARRSGRRWRASVPRARSSRIDS